MNSACCNPTAFLSERFAKSAKLKKAIRSNLKELGYGV